MACIKKRGSLLGFTKKKPLQFCKTFRINNTDPSLLNPQSQQEETFCSYNYLLMSFNKCKLQYCFISSVQCSKISHIYENLGTYLYHLPLLGASTSVHFFFLQKSFKSGIAKSWCTHRKVMNT